MRRETRRNYSAHPRFGPRVTFWASIYGVSYGDSISANKSYLDALSSSLNLSTEVGNHAQNCLDSLSTYNKLLQVEGNRTVAHDVICCNLRGVMEIFRYIPHPKTNAFLDCIYHSQAPCRPLLSPADSRRRASKVVWDLCPERVQELAGYPLNGRPSAVTMLELLYNSVARYDDLSILK